MLPTKTLSKIMGENVINSKLPNNGHLRSFPVLITARMIRPTAELLVDSGYRELNSKILAGSNEENMIPLYIDVNP